MASNLKLVRMHVMLSRFKNAPALIESNKTREATCGRLRTGQTHTLTAKTHNSNTQSTSTQKSSQRTQRS